MDLLIILILILVCIFFIMMSLVRDTLSEKTVWWMPWSFNDFVMEHLCNIKSGRTGWYDDDCFPFWANQMTFSYLKSKGLITIISSDTNRVIYLTRRGKFVRWYAKHIRGFEVN